jgi:apolipoprotein D and lipocalin family protein
MGRNIRSVFFTIGAMLTVTQVLAAKSYPPMQVVPSVDLTRYMGKWYEIARLPNWFQRDCASDTSALYTLRPDGNIKVVNECRKAAGHMKSATGKARIADKKGPNTKLKVTFFWPFSGNYWIIDLDPGYQWVVVGEPGRDYLWILSRQPHLDQDLYESIVERAKQQGYEVEQLIKTAHAAR